MRIRLTILCVLAFVVMAVAQQRISWAPGQALVRFADDITLKEARGQLDPTTFTINRALVPRLNIYLVKFDSKLPVPEALEMLRGYPQLKWAQADHYIGERLTPNDPSFSSMWDMNQLSDVDIDAPEAWDITTGGTDGGGDDIVVAIVDGGCQLDHPDLNDNIWVNALEAAGTGGVDDDGNGYIDDINGWDAYSDDGTIPEDDHGTHVSGTVGAEGNNNNQVVGVNWNVRLMEVAGSTSQTSIVSIAYNYVLNQKTLWISSGGTQGANIVSTNSSFGVDQADCETDSYPIWNDLYNSMGAVGILSCAATANANWDIDAVGDVPTGCSSPFMIAVTNTTILDNKNSGAGYGATTIDLGAPGTNILSTDVGGTTSTKTGTSMATPHVAGTVAFLYAAASESFYLYSQLYPDSAALIVKDVILATTDPISALAGITVSGGRLNLFAAADSIQNYVAPLPVDPVLDYVSHSIDDSNLGDNNGRFDADETVELILTIDNLGVDATTVLGTISTSDPYLSITDGDASFGNIDSLASADNSGNPFVIASLASTPLDHEATVDLHLSADGDYSNDVSFTITINPKVVVWSDDFEGGDLGWTHASIDVGWGDEWHLSTQRSFSSSHSWKCGDMGAGDYSPLLDAGLVSPEILLPEGAELSFRSWLKAEDSGSYPDSCYDGTIIEISQDGVAYSELFPIGGYTHTYRYDSGSGSYSGPLPGVECFSNEQVWLEQKIDLTSYELQHVWLRFRFSSDAAVQEEGCYIDDVTIRGAALPVPDPVIDLVIVPEGNDIRLMWTAPASGAVSYDIYRSLDGAIEPINAEFLGSTEDTTYVDSNAAADFESAIYTVSASNN